jgi:predicted RecA/RadA family phage recombinase
MTKKFVQEGTRISLASEGANNVGKVSGNLVVVGKMFAVAAADNPAVTGQTFAGETEGVFELPKLAEGITQGSRVFWDGTGITATATGAAPVGSAWETAPTGDTTIKVKINSVLPPLTGSAFP